MANRFPLIVNPATKRIQELISGDNLDLTGNGIVANSSLGTSGQYLKSNGATVVWDNPGDVYLTATQTITNKTFNTCNISGTTNTLTNIPNNALVNSAITVNGVSIPLGGSVSTPDNNTTYSVSVVDGTDASRKSIRLTSGGTGAGVNDDVTLVAGSNVTLSRTGDEITINSSYVDTNTITRLVASGGTLTSGDLTLTAASGSTTAGADGVNTTTGASTVTMSGSTITIGSQYVNTVTRVRGTASGTYESGDLTIAAGTNVTVTPSGKTISISSVDTITRAKVNNELDANAVTGIVNFIQSGATTINRVGQNITISSTDNNTVTSLKVNSEADLNAVTGIINITGSGFTTVSRSGNNFTITSTDANTTYSASATGGLTETSTVFALKNVANLTNTRVLKWDSTNSQLTNSIITDNGSTVTIAGNLTVTGTTTTVDSTTLVVADAQIELRKGNSILGADGGVQVNRTTNSSGVVTTYTAMQWYETGAYWRIFDGANEKRLVTETETQTLTNKTLTSPVLNGSPQLGQATATSINGLTITAAVSPVLTILGGKTFTVNKTLTLTATNDGSTIDFGAPSAGAIVAYRSDSLNVFATTSSSQLAGLISDETGSGNLVFNTNPTFLTSLITTSTSFSLFDTTVTGISAFSAATTINIGATTGTTTIRNNLTVNGNTTLGDASSDTINVLGIFDSRNNDIRIRGNSADPMIVGRGGNAIASNTALGKGALNGNTSGSQNTAVGYEAGFTLNSGASNSAFGWNALRNAGIAVNNVAIGKSAAVNMSDGARNTAVGVSALQDTASGNNNVGIGYFAGAGATGSGNVLIGPAPDGNSTNATHTPPTPAGNNQLVIGSGTSTWIRGDSSFDVQFPQNANVGGNLTVSGSLTVNGTLTTINTNVLSIDDKEINLADIAATTFTASTTNGSPTITVISSTANLIPGVTVFITAGATLPANTTIVSITGNTITLSNPVTGSTGNASFSASGVSDTTADGGGIRVRGTTDKTLSYVNATTAFTSSENFNLATGKAYRIGNVQIANGLTTTLGPTSGTWSLGAGVTASSLTSVGTLSSLNVSGNATFDTNTLFVDATNNRVHIGEAGTAQSTLNISGTGGQGGGIQINRNTSGNPTSGQSLGSIAFKGVTSANSNAAGEVLIEAIASENHSGSTAGTELAIYTKPSGTGPGSSPTKRVTITSDGKLLVKGPSNPSSYGLSGGIMVQPGNGNSGLTLTSGSATDNTYINFSKGTASNAEQFAFAIGRDGTANQGIVKIDDVDVARFGSTGIVMPSGKGIDFSATANSSGTMTSELLSDYEEGTWTPVFSIGGSTAGVTYSSGPYGYYTKVGNMVTVWGGFRLSNNGSATGIAQISGLPFSVTDIAAFKHPGIGSVMIQLKANNTVWAIFTAGSTVLEFRAQSVTNGDTAATDTDFDDDTGILFTITYKAS